MKKTAKEAFSPEALEGKKLEVTPVEKPKAEPAKAETPAKPEAKAEKPKAEATPTPAANPLDGIEPPEGSSEKTIKDWKSFKEKAAAEINKAANEKAAIAAELATYKNATPADAAEIERLRAEYKAVQERLAVYDVSSHPDFQRQYTEPKNKALTNATELAKDYQLPDAASLKSLLELPRPEFSKKLSEMAKDMPSFDQSKFFTSMDEARRLQGEEKGALSKAGELRQALQQKAAQEARNAFMESRKNYETKIPVLTVPEGADEETIAEVNAFNSARAAALADAEKMTFGQMSEREVADAMVQAANLKVVANHLIPSLQKRLAKAEEIIKAQTAELQGIAKAKTAPSFSGDQAPQQKDPSKMTFSDAMAEAKRRAGTQ